ncbi:Hypothetical protein PFR_JS21-2_1959 [Propionibacterium freudenreichii]|nr:Hypothetical protein PFR_JS21-1_1960 [Propionibacterium freudenreichii]SCQ60960.1 Hypothetical protein PFR_JS25-1_1815 [Propionibacterium freudenreichii]SCQ65219.1 Hypothetical protein PFR_JS21-2_1959 [Propionibacterium freudenreichii]SCQ75576.1 Hypothetical protein PFR_JS20-1_1821 [Propionibacterium freudenreichii]SCQ82988.1 Hypothetical protein PFR_JS20-2_1828 [Propionibacterium freudenreichii]
MLEYARILFPGRASMKGPSRRRGNNGKEQILAKNLAQPQ